MFKRWSIFLLLCIGYILVYFHRLCANVVATDMMKDLAAGGILTGLLGAAYFYPYAFMQVPAGLLSDSFGPRKTITTFFLIAAIGSIILGLSKTAGIAITGRLLVGVGVAMLFVPTMKILSQWFKKEEFPLMTGILVAMGGIGSLIATSPLAYMSQAYGWRFSFILIAVLTFFVTIFIWIIVRDAPVKKEGSASQKILTMPELKNAIKQVLSTPSFWPLALWFFFDCAIFFTFGGLWGAPYLMHVYHYSKTEAGNIMSMLAFGMIVGSPLYGFLSDKVVKGRKLLLIISSIFSVLLMASLFFYLNNISRLMLYIICFGIGICTNAIVSIGFTAAKELFPIEIAGTATGIINFFPFAAGAIFQQLTGVILEYFGKVNDAFKPEGYRVMFLILFLCAVIAFVSSLFIKETFKKN